MTVVATQFSPTLLAFSAVGTKRVVLWRGQTFSTLHGRTEGGKLKFPHFGNQMQEQQTIQYCLLSLDAP